MLHLYDSNIPSGNGYKVHLLLSHLRLPYHTTDLDLLTTPAETRLPAYLALNPNGRIPLIILDDATHTVLPESSAILYYLAKDTPYLPSTHLGVTQVLRWMFFEQFSHEQYVAGLRFATHWIGLENVSAETRERLQTRGQAALDTMEAHLEGKTFFVEEMYTIADIALFAYTQFAELVGFAVGGNVKAWLQRVREQEGYVTIKDDPSGKAPSMK
ncbi:glutathione S-transferase [Eremomyces bilateralis CBS 781.70]|uniref:Glutathione S-transferase n=1 Tax=Eremomyces bilateralis CBS 781.70 TaxID=1392243 RepID=A0A6G1FWI6_9PEZI|nr:glutathione S-transferase [Eremomyces bilateralis CBS 781.70]KAF1809989.1 glutathione S-transferase [Eremomyces bilateralis CBS 781.70]